MAKRINIILKKIYAIYAIDIYLVIERAVVPNEVPTTLASVPRDEYLAVTRNDKERKKNMGRIEQKKVFSSERLNSFKISGKISRSACIPRPGRGTSPSRRRRRSWLGRARGCSPGPSKSARTRSGRSARHTRRDPSRRRGRGTP